MKSTLLKVIGLHIIFFLIQITCIYFKYKFEHLLINIIVILVPNLMLLVDYVLTKSEKEKSLFLLRVPIIFTSAAYVLLSFLVHIIFGWQFNAIAQIVIFVLFVIFRLVHLIGTQKIMHNTERNRLANENINNILRAVGTANFENEKNRNKILDLIKYSDPNSIKQVENLERQICEILSSKIISDEELKKLVFLINRRNALILENK